MRALAVIGPQPLQALPERKALAAHGVKGLEVLSGWSGWFAPAGTPPEVVRRLNAELARIVTIPRVRDRMLAQGTEPGSRLWCRRIVRLRGSHQRAPMLALKAVTWTEANRPAVW